MNTQNSIIKIIRLQSGDDIIAEYESDDDIVHLKNPMLLVFKRSVAGSAMVMLPWLPVELIKSNSASIYYTDVVTILDPEPELEEYYKNAVNLDVMRLKENGDLFLKYLLEKMDVAVNELDDEDDMNFDLVDVDDTQKNTYH
jgi:hypothetical protein